MKIITTFVLAFIIWYLLWAYSSFNMLVDFTSETASSVFSESLQDVYTWDNVSLTWQDFSDYFERQRQELMQNFNDKIQETQDDIKSRFHEYLREKIDGIFSWSED